MGAFGSITVVSSSTFVSARAAMLVLAVCSSLCVLCVSGCLRVRSLQTKDAFVVQHLADSGKVIYTAPALKPRARNTIVLLAEI